MRCTVKTFREVSMAKGVDERSVTLTRLVLRRQPKRGTREKFSEVEGVLDWPGRDDVNARMVRGGGGGRRMGSVGDWNPSGGRRERGPPVGPGGRPGCTPGRRPGR